jgi:hypothetical protein
MDRAPRVIVCDSHRDQPPHAGPEDAGATAGGERLRASAAPARIDLHHLPAGAEHFLGRGPELAALDAAWSPGSGIAVVELIAPRRDGQDGAGQTLAERGQGARLGRCRPGLRLVLGPGIGPAAGGHPRLADLSPGGGHLAQEARVPAGAGGAEQQPSPALRTRRADRGMPRQAARVGGRAVTAQVR